MESFSTNQSSISFVKQTFSDEIISPTQLPQSQPESKLRVDYQTCNPQTKSLLIQLLHGKRQMMLVSLLQFLSFDQISKLSLSCKKVKKLIDPLSSQDQQLVNKDNLATEKPVQLWYIHIKYVAAIQLLIDGYNMGSSEIDSKFGVELKQLSDYQYLNGRVFREQLAQCLQSPPAHLFQDMNQYLQFSSDSIQNDTFTSVFDVFTMLQNPLTDSLNRIKIDYNTGGFFCLYNQNIVLSAKSYPADYQVLIPGISSNKAYKQLSKLNNQKQTEEEQLEQSLDTLKLFNQQTSSIELEHINGIGRIIQYQGMCDSKQIWVIYEGEIQQGRAHGFGRAICGDSKNNFIGYFEKGFKFGLGIELNRKGKVINQGVFNNKNIVKKMDVNCLEQNMERAEILKLDKEYWSEFLPFTGQTGYQLQIRDDLNFLDGFEDELDVRDDDQFDMELQPESKPN